MKNLDINDIPAMIKPLLQQLKRYIPFMFILFILLSYGFLIVRIGQLSTLQPDDEAVLQELSTIKRPRIDPEVADKLLQLEEQNIEVQSIFKDARENPFSE
jgi:hypothetical protein